MAAKVKNKGGRPSTADKVDKDQLKALYLDGKTDQEIADFFKISRKTLINWRKKNPEFILTLKNDWKAVADHRVERSLYERACGYSHPETKAQWDKGGDKDGGFIAMNLGISATIRAINDILRFLDTIKGLKLGSMSSEDIANAIIPYLKPLARFINGLDAEQIKKLRGHVGGSAVDIVLREFQSEINDEFADFNPEGLDKWKRERTGKYNAPARNIGDDLQIRIREHIFDQLRVAYGSKDKRWWSDGVPKDIQIVCSKQRIEEGTGQDEDYTLLLHYEKIVKHNKDLLLNDFTPPKAGSASVDKKLSWFPKWNSIRNKYSHPERGKVTEEEYNFVRELSDWLNPRLSSGQLSSMHFLEEHAQAKVM